MRFSTTYLVVFIATASASTNIEDLSDYEVKERKLTRAKSNKCTIQVVDYLEIPGSSLGADEDLVFECELDEVDGSKSLPIFATASQTKVFKKLLEDGNLVAAESSLEFGFGNAVYNHEQFYISPLLDVEASIKKGADKMTNTGRRLDGRRLSVMGDKPMLAVRVIDKNGLAHSDDAATMSDNIFGSGNDQVNLRSQLLACSHGKLNIVYDGQVWENTVPEVHRAAPGVIEVTIDLDITANDRYTIHNAVTTAVNTKLGITLPGPFEQVMYILEKCYVGCGWAAYAYINSWMSVYQAAYYYMPGVQVHELGHNFGMAHSGGLDGQTYTDHTGMMGNPLYSDEVGKMCYNPAKNWYLSRGGAFDWYGDQKLLLEPASGNGDFFQSIDMVGIADFSGDQSAPPVVVKLETNTNTDYFIGFNRAIGSNAQNDEADNEIVIVETGSNGEAYSQSYLKAHLVQGESYTIENFSVGVLNLTITAKKIDLSLDPAVASIEISTTGAPPPSCNTVSIAITQDSYPLETSWNIKNAAEEVIALGDVDGVAGLNLLDGNYDFTINDSYGDGICCDFGNGSYQVIVGGEVIKTGGDFGSQETTSFEVSCDSNPTTNGPSPQPFASESKEPSSSPTFVPSITASDKPSFKPSVLESMEPASSPTFAPSITVSDKPSSKPSVLESMEPSSSPTFAPSITVSDKPSSKPSVLESMEPSPSPTFVPSITASDKPSVLPTLANSSNPTMQLSGWPTSPPVSQQPVTQPISQPSSPPVTQQPGTSQPISQPPVVFPSLGPAISKDLVEVTILTDNYPGETSWQLFDSDGSLLLDGDSYTVRGEIYKDSLYVDNWRTLTFRIEDNHGDGICCSYGLGSYSIKVNGETILVGGAFGTFEEKKLDPFWFCDRGVESIEGEILCKCSPSEYRVIVNLLTDRYPFETSWSVETCDGMRVYTSNRYSNRFTQYSEKFCISKEEPHLFKIIDSYGDGICCAYGQGNYSIELNGETVATSEGRFSRIETKELNGQCQNAIAAIDDPRDKALDIDPQCETFTKKKNCKKQELCKWKRKSKVCQVQAKTEEKKCKYCRATGTACCGTCVKRGPKEDRGCF